MELSLQMTLLIIMTVVAGIAAQVAGSLTKLPSIVFLLLFGIGLGPSGLNLLHPHLLGEGLNVLVSLSVALILFEGGLSLELQSMEEVSGSIRNLVTVGMLMTLVGAGVAAHWLSEFPWAIAFLYASLVVVTGPTVINPLLKQVRADRQVSAILEGEGVLIDPIGAILAVVVLQIVLQGNASPIEVLQELGSGLGTGAAIGGMGGWGLGQLLKRAAWITDELKNLVVLAGMWGLFGVAQALVNESGLTAAVTAGIALHLADLPKQRSLREFKAQLSTLAVSMLFILLSADLAIASLFALGWGSLLTVLVLMLVVRPLNILICTWNSGLSWRQKVFLSWVAPRGIVAASIASLFAVSLTNQGINGGDSIKGLVFLTIMITVGVQGLTAKPVAEWLNLQAPEPCSLPSTAECHAGQTRQPDHLATPE
ncbi:MAG: sodium:proton antiporter [Aphanocapsa sp. GSE-SYN-MK-11-07L]|jgi:NhaP-type Na+/H+ or K+/H+ antiporter|nr:sodium:proton antiporter [Aphanocapsa sp. GSE-SYN-MK-11-07L]